MFPLALLLGVLAAIHPLPSRSGAITPSPVPDALAPEPGVATPRAQQIGAYVTTVLVPSLTDPGASAVIIRRPQGTGTLNLILVTPQTTPADFLKAVRILNRARRVQGEVVRQEVRASVTPVKRAGAVPANDHANAEQHLARLRASAPLDLPGIGRHQSVTNSLPPLR